MAQVTRSWFPFCCLQSESGITHPAHPTEALKPQWPSVANALKSSLCCLCRRTMLPSFCYSSALNNRCSPQPQLGKRLCRLWSISCCWVVLICHGTHRNFCDVTRKPDATTKPQVNHRIPRYKCHLQKPGKIKVKRQSIHVSLTIYCLLFNNCMCAVLITIVQFQSSIL